MVPAGSSKLSYLEQQLGGVSRSPPLVHPNPRAQPHSGTHFSLTSWACLGFTTPMGLDRSRKTTGLLRSNVGDT